MILKLEKLLEFVDKDIEELQKKVAEKLGYKLVDHKLELYAQKIKKKLINCKKKFSLKLSDAK